MTDQASSYRSKIEKALSRFGKNGTEIPDNSNTGTLLGEYYLWKTVSTYAERMEKKALDVLKSEGLYDEEEAKTKKEGEYEILTTKGFAFSISVTKPVRRFNKDNLVKALTESKYKIPLAAARLFVEDAYEGTTPQVRKHVLEK
jgi:hypothetical protein